VVNAALPLGVTQYPLYRRLVGNQGRSGQVQKTLPPPEFNPPNGQHGVRRCTNYAIHVHDKPAFTVLYLLMFSAAQTTQHCMKHTEAQFFTYQYHDICGHSVDKSVRSTVVQLVHMESILNSCAF
jgi:hypothetical protein